MLEMFTRPDPTVRTRYLSKCWVNVERKSRNLFAARVEAKSRHWAACVRVTFVIRKQVWRARSVGLTHRRRRCSPLTSNTGNGVYSALIIIFAVSERTACRAIERLRVATDYQLCYVVNTADEYVVCSDYILKRALSACYTAPSSIAKLLPAYLGSRPGYHKDVIGNLITRGQPVKLATPLREWFLLIEDLITGTLFGNCEVVSEGLSGEEGCPLTNNEVVRSVWIDFDLLKLASADVILKKHIEIGICKTLSQLRNVRQGLGLRANSPLALGDGSRSR